MGIIKNYKSFLNENIINKNDNISDILDILDMIKDASTDDILEFRDELLDLNTSFENVNEGFISDFIYNLKNKFRKSFDDRIWKYIINRKKEFYLNLVDKLNIFDLTSLDDVFKNHPGFKVESLYLAGGMDKAKDVGAGWRLVVENEFENYPGKRTGLPEISLKEFGNKEPKRVVDGIYLDMFLKKPEKVKKLYNLPLILNPVRKEVDRTKDVAFLKGTSTYKTFDYETDPEEYEPTMTDIRKTMSRSIEVDDEHLVRISDFIFLGLNTAAAAGTYGELQMQSFLNKPIFVWMNDKEWKFSDFSLWTFPHISKLARNEDEMKILVSTIMSNSK